MKLINTLSCKRLLLFGSLALLLNAQTTNAQICASPSTIIYGLTSGGMIYPINVTNGNVGAVITPAYTGNAPSSANGLGFNPTNGRFYYFKRNPDKVTQEFCVFDPGTGGYTIKASCPTTNTVHTGCVTANGLGYYTLDVMANLYYYNILANTWTLITSNFVDQFGNNVSNIIKTHDTGDIAIDGLGNLWMLVSSNTEYGLYKIPAAALTTLPQVSITVTRLLVPTTPTPAGNGFAGIAFNPTGQIFLATITDNKLYRLENNFSLTSLGTFNTGGVGNDLTSCSFPFGVLPVNWESFTAVANDGNVILKWTVSSEVNNPVFYIEHSIDGKSWNVIGTIQTNNVDLGMMTKETYTHYNAGPGSHQYRIRQTGASGKPLYSTIKTVVVQSNAQIAVWPNPAKDVVYVQSNASGNSAVTGAKIFDQAGQLVKQAELKTGMNTINITALKPGMYVMQVQLVTGEVNNQKLIKQ